MGILNKIRSAKTTESLPEGTDKRQQGTTDKVPTENGQASPKPKKSLYQRCVDARTGRNNQISDDDLRKYTGMTKAQLNEWSKDRSGVAGNQLAGSLAMGPASGLGGMMTAEGYGGWGPDAAGKLKFPPKPAHQEKKAFEEKVD